MSDKKYQTMAQLLGGLKYHKNCHEFALDMVKRIWDRSGYESPMWRNRANGEQAKAKAFKDEIMRRKANEPSVDQA